MTRSAAIRNLRRAHARHDEALWARRCAGTAREAFQLQGKVSARDRDLALAEALLARLVARKDS